MHWRVFLYSGERCVNRSGVSVIPTNTQLITQQAADHLGISLPPLVWLQLGEPVG